MKKIYSFIIASFFTFTLMAQSPSFEWGIRIGSFYGDVGIDIATDQNGNVYSTGEFENTADFDPGSGVLSLTPAGGADIYIQKLDPIGNLLWAYHFGDTSYNSPKAIITDLNNNCYIAGTAGNSDINPGTGVFFTNSSSNFILKLDSNGAFQWGANFSSTNIYDISIDQLGNIYAIGIYSGNVDFDPSSGTSIMNGGSASMFIVKLSNTKNFIWGKSFPINTSLWDVRPQKITIDPIGNPILTGYFQGTVDFDPSANTSLLTSNGFIDAYTLKLDTSGNFLWAINMGGSGEDIGYGVSTDDLGNIYTTGKFVLTADFDPGNGISNLSTVNTNSDGFVQKVDPNGNFVWAKQLGGGNQCYSYDVKIRQNQVLVLSLFYDTLDADPSANLMNLISNGSRDMSLINLDTSGSFIWANSFGSIALDYGWAVDIDPFGNILTTGGFQSLIDLDPGAGTNYINSNGLTDAYVQKLSSNTVGLESTSEKQSSIIKPNPTKGDIEIRLPAIHTTIDVQIYNIEGKMVYNSAFNNTDNIELEFEGENGIYIVKVKSDKGTESFKLIKK